MEENEVFLKYLIDEEIYIVDEKTTDDPEDKAGSVDDNTIIGSQGQESRQKPDEKIKIKAETASDQKEDTGRSGDIDNVTDAGISTDTKDNTDISSTGEQKETKRYKDTTVLLLDFDDRASMIPELEDLLAKILEAINLDLDSVEMVFRDEFNKLEVKSFINCSVIAFLQIIPGHIKALFLAEKYTINTIIENQFLASDTLNDLNQNISLKRKLWGQLKSIYGI